MEWTIYDRLILLLLIVQVDVTGYLVGSGLFGVASQQTFALLLVVELVAFTMTSYIFRKLRLNAVPRRLWIVVGAVLIGGLFLSSLVFS